MFISLGSLLYILHVHNFQKQCLPCTISKKNLSYSRRTEMLYFSSMSSLISASAGNHLFWKHRYNTNRSTPSGKTPAATAVAPWKRLNAELKKYNSGQKSRLVKTSATGKMQDPVQPLPRGWTWCKGTQCPDLLRVTRSLHVCAGYMAFHQGSCTDIICAA